jgi:hypothetical protein
MWRDEAGRGRAEKASEIAKTGRDGRNHRRFLAADLRGPPQDDQAVKTKPLPGSRLRILDQGPGPTRARSSRKRPLERLGTMARLAQGWAGHAGHTRRMRLTSTGTPALGVDSPCWVAHWANRKCLIGFTSLAPLRRRAARGSSAHRTKALAAAPFPSAMVGRFPEAPISCSKRKAGISDGSRPHRTTSRAVTGWLAHGGGKRGRAPGRLPRGFPPWEAGRAGCRSPCFPEPVPREPL